MNGQHERFGDEYLWNRRGPVDLEVARLEQLLAPYALPRQPERQPVQLSGRRLPLLAVAAVAAVLAFAVLAGVGWYWHRLQWQAGQPWQLVVAAGQVSINGRMIVDAAAELQADSVIRTASDGFARIEIARIGELLLGGGSQLQLLQTRSGRHRVALERGTLWARVWAPPYSFGVTTAGGVAYDLGCEFLIRTDADGNGVLQVASGWVQFERGDGEVLIPQGAQVELHAHAAPGTPHAIDASGAFAAALRRIDVAGPAAPATGPVVQNLLTEARPQDAITLVSLLTRYPQLADGPLFDRAVAYLDSADDIERAAVRAGDPVAVNALWQGLPYPRTKRWWLQWPDAFASGEPPVVLLSPERR